TATAGRIDRFLPRQRHYVALRPTANGSRQVAPRRGWTASRKQKTRERRQTFIQPVDGRFEFSRLVGANAQARARRFIGRRWNAQIRADVEEVVLNAAEQTGFGKVGMAGEEEAKDCVYLIHRTVGGDARVVLGHARSVAQRGFALVAGLGVNAGEVNHDEAER